jgi:hypothetical protein
MELLEPLRLRQEGENAKVEETRPAGDWTRERVSFDAAYGNEPDALA